MARHIIEGSLRSVFIWAVVGALWFPASMAAASGFSMGGMQTVGYDGALDAVRNPSLLASRPGANSIGFILDASAYAPHLSSYGISTGSGLSSVRVHETRSMAGNVYLAYCRSLRNGGVGIAVEPGRNFQGVAHRYNRTVAGVDAAAARYASVRGTGREISPRMAVSYGGVVSGNHALGVRLSGGYGVMSDRYTSVGVLTWSPDHHHRARKRVDEIAGELVAGYSYRDRDSQAGVMLRSGRFAWQKTRIRYLHMDFVTPKYWSGSVVEPYYMIYDRGVSLVAGGYRRLASFVAIALEGECEVPVTYHRKDLRYDEFTWFFGVTNNLAVSRKGLIGLKAGAEFLPSGPVTIALGAGYLTERERRHGRSYRENTAVERVSASLGVDVTAVSNMLITAGARLDHCRERKRITASNQIMNSISFGGLARLYGVSTYLGLSADW